jgi:hypothetical protein
MSVVTTCPHCGLSFEVTDKRGQSAEAATVEELTHEIQHLRATVARLRGAPSLHPVSLAARDDQAAAR